MLFFALSPLYVWHAQDARMYMLLTSVDVVAIYALTMILTTETSVVFRDLRGLPSGGCGDWR